MKSVKILLILGVLTFTSCSWSTKEPTDEDFANANAETFCLAQQNIMKDINEQALQIYEKYGFDRNKSYDDFEKRAQNHDEKLRGLIETKIRALGCADENAIKEYLTPLDQLQIK
jgi:hypothetical protein